MAGLIAIAALALMQPAVQAAALRQLDSAITSEAPAGFSGVVLIARGDTILLHKSYGRAHATGITPERLAFWLASNSKQFTAAAVLRLEEMKRLSVHDTITRFFPNVPADKRNITIHQLLTHTSGLPHAYAADGIHDRAEAVRLILALKLRARPGEKYSYSNDGYTLLAAIVDIASRVGFDIFLEDSLFRRAGLKTAGVWGRELADVRIAEVADAKRSGSVPPTVYRDGRSIANWGYRAASGAFASASDVHRWLHALRSGRVLEPEAVGRLLGRHVLVSSDSTGQSFAAYGWGTRVVGGCDVSYAHTGNEDWLGHNGVVRFTPSGNIVIVLSNSGDIDGASWAGRINRLIRRYYDPR